MDQVSAKKTTERRKSTQIREKEHTNQNNLYGHSCLLGR